MSLSTSLNWLTSLQHTIAQQIKDPSAVMDQGLTEASQTHTDLLLADYSYIDSALAQQICEYEQQSGQLSAGEISILGTLVVQLSKAQSNGHVCLNLSSSEIASACFLLSQQSVTAEQVTTNSIVDVLTRSSTVSSGETDGSSNMSPLILDGELLYFSRYWYFEQVVADKIQQRLRPINLNKFEQDELQALLQELFPKALAAGNGSEIDWQKVAVANSVLSLFSVITGGPGTGKTTTVTKLLAALLFLDPNLTIAMAAPTGKAAARLTESIRSAKQTLAAQFEVANLIPEESSTLHRLLGWTPRGFKHHQHNPLPCDVLLIDEASMIDLTMMANIMSAITENTRLILLGDKDQLASVEAGSVLGDLSDLNGLSSAGDLGNHGLVTKERYRMLVNLCDLNNLQQQSLITKDRLPLLTDSVSQLRKSYRFNDQSGIGQLAKAVNQCDVGAVKFAFKKFNDIHLHELAKNKHTSYGVSGEVQVLELKMHPVWKEKLVQGYGFYLSKVHQLESFTNSSDRDQYIVETLKAFLSFRVLSATREGRNGVKDLNINILQCLIQEGLLNTEAKESYWYAGKPVMISANDYGLNLFNGDIGIALPDQNGELRVYFESSQDNSVAEKPYRAFLPSRLPQHETAFAMTVHKSQGSEFDEVLFVLPDTMNPSLTKELLYTAITRAKKLFSCFSKDEIFYSTVAQKIIRDSGLKNKLWKVGQSFEIGTDKKSDDQNSSSDLNENLSLF